jgi:chromosomal replication initiation ATPase DnaA
MGMKIRDFFHGNPFQNLVIASHDTASFQLRGHEDQFLETWEDIQKTIRQNEYNPELARHTIVFGEWGHGKTHFLRIIDNRINTQLKGQALAIYYEPTTVEATEVLQEIAQKVDFQLGSLENFVSYLRQDNFPQHIFLLIDESQSLVGEDVHGNYEKDINEYYSD